MAKIAANEPLSDKDKETLEVHNAKMARFYDPELSSVAEAYLLKRYAFDKYRKRTAAIGPQRSFIAKGTELESDAIELIEKLRKTTFEKPSESISNDFLLGKCDAIDRGKGEIIETKVLWSMDTYMGNYKKLPTKVWYQVQGYMDIYQLQKASVYYVILNTPPHLLEREFSRIWQRYQHGEINKEKYLEENERFDLAYSCTHIPAKRRVIHFEINYCHEVFPQIYRRVERSRLWLADQEVKHMNAKKVVVLNEDYLNIAEPTEENSTQSDPAEPYQGD